MKHNFWVIIILILISCNSAPPKQSSDNNSAIAITVAADFRALLSITNIKPQQVFFIKLDSANDSLEKKSGILSVYNYESWWGNIKSGSTDNFLLDVKPGIYAAVAAFGQLNGNGGVDCIVLFPEKMIKSTIIDVKPNSMAFVGKYTLKRGSFVDNIEDADYIQKYYYKPLIHLFKQNHFIVPRLITIAPSLLEIQQSKETEITFLRKYQRIFKNTDWENKIKNRVEELKDYN